MNTHHNYTAQFRKQFVAYLIFWAFVAWTLALSFVGCATGSDPVTNDDPETPADPGMCVPSAKEGGDESPPCEDAGVPSRVEFVDSGVRDTGSPTQLDTGTFVDRMDAVARDTGIPSRPDTGVSSSMDVARVDTTPSRIEEICNGLDDNGDGLPDEGFYCVMGSHWDRVCRTSCGSLGFALCEAPLCTWSARCYTLGETCGNSVDDDCDGLVDCADSECSLSSFCVARLDAGVSSPRDASVPIADTGTSFVDVPSPRDTGSLVPDVGVTSGATISYEFRIMDIEWDADDPFNLRDWWWVPVTCLNTGSIRMEPRGDGWRRCDLAHRMALFTGTFFTPHPPAWCTDGQVGTIGSWPTHCSITGHAQWRITDLTTGRRIFEGPAEGLDCQLVDGAERHRLPPLF